MSLFSTLNTGTSGLKAAEIAMSTTGHNISNANNEYYTRQRVVTQASTPFHDIPGDVGTGVSITSIVRIHDEFVYSRLKDSSNSLSYDSTMKNSLEQVAQFFPDLQDAGLGVDLQNYYSSWNDFTSNSDDGAQKIALVQNAMTLSANLKTSRDSVRSLQDSINDQLKTNIDEVNRIGQDITNLNISIGRVEVDGSSRANDLRDQRDNLELSLSKLLNVDVFKGDLKTENVIDANLTDQGSAYHMNISGQSFVDGMSFHPIVIDNTGNKSNYFSIYSKSQDGSTVELTDKISGGKIGAMLDLRGRSIDVTANSGFPADGILQGYVDDLDTFSKTFIEQTNNIYAKSAQDGMTSVENIDLKADTPLSEYGNTINKGSFDVIVYDKQGNEVARKAIGIDVLTTMDDTTMSSSIVGQFNESTDDNGDNNSQNDVDDYFAATFGSGVLTLDAKNNLSGYTIAIEDHGTNFAGAIGLSTFLSGDSASNMNVALKYRDDPAKVSAFSAPIQGNNVVANDMVQMQFENFDFYRNEKPVVNESIEGFYRFVTARIGADGESIGRKFETTSALFSTINAEFQSISGVNIDEELTDLIKYQTAYGANAKVISTIDQMLNTLLGIKQ